jgi:Protein of unknown function (DUF4197)
LRRPTGREEPFPGLWALAGGFIDVAADADLEAPGACARGYQNHPVYRIKLPEPVQPLASRLRQFGLGGQVDRIELLMNQGAEQAAAQAKPVFIDAVRAMTITDALAIVRGNETAAADYFKQRTSPDPPNRDWVVVAVISLDPLPVRSVLE